MKFLKENWKFIIISIIVIYALVIATYYVLKPDTTTKELKETVKQAQVDKANIRDDVEDKSSINVSKSRQLKKQAHEPILINRSIEEDADYILNYGK